MILSVPRPLRDAVKDFESALGHRNPNNRRLLEGKQAEVLDAYEDYDGLRGCSYEIAPVQLEKGEASALRGNYRLTRPGEPLEGLRDELMQLPKRGVCPMCGRGKITSLDHHLPKEIYPEFAILAFNLVPVCGSCNNAKLNYVGTREGGRFLHPFYELLDTSPSLLLARVAVSEEEGSVLVSYEVNPALRDEVYLNASFHFRRLKLSEHYVQGAVVELINRYEVFAAQYAAGGGVAVAQFASREAGHMRRMWGGHYWRAALYDAVATAEGFCDGGFSTLVC